MSDNKKALRRLKLQVQMSIDGCIAGPNNEMDWMVWDWDEKLKEYVNKIHEPVDTILLGRKMTNEFISYWSNVLNTYQAKQDYEKIEENIKKYISLYAIDLLRTNNSYNINILISNISRWNKISNKYAFSNKEKSYCNFIFVLLDIYKSISRSSLNNKEQININEIFGQFDLMLLYQDYSPLISFAIENNKSNILDKLFQFDKQIYETVIAEYNLDVSKNTVMKGQKLIKLIKYD